MVQNIDLDSDFRNEDMLLVSSNQFMVAWIFYSVCSFHMTPNREWLTSNKSGSFSCVYLGDDKPYTVVGIGIIKIQMHDGIVRNYVMLGIYQT